MKLLEQCALATVLLAAWSNGQAQSPIDGDKCEHPNYKVHLFSKSPLVIYLEGFITTEERIHMLEVSKDRFEHSRVASANTTGHAALPFRTSSSTSLPYDSVTSCIEERALLFQSLATPPSHVEPIQLVRYGEGEHYHFHTDWFLDPLHTTAEHGGQRVSSFFGYVGVGDGTTGGGTNFPMLDAPLGDESERWCAFVDCDEEWDKGVTFRPIEGNVVYWENMVDGVGDQRNLHAGLPVTSGWKVGMNIWTRQGPVADTFKQ